MIKDAEFPVEPLIERLQEVTWASPIKVTIEKMAGMVEMFHGKELMARWRKCPIDPFEEFKHEIQSDLDIIGRKFPEVTHFRVAIFNMMKLKGLVCPHTFEEFDNCIVRYSKFYYIA